MPLTFPLQSPPLGHEETRLATAFKQPALAISQVRLSWVGQLCGTTGVIASPDKAHPKRCSSAQRNPSRQWVRATGITWPYISTSHRCLHPPTGGILVTKLTAMMLAIDQAQGHIAGGPSHWLQALPIWSQWTPPSLTPTDTSSSTPWQHPYDCPHLNTETHPPLLLTLPRLSPFHFPRPVSSQHSSFSSTAGNILAKSLLRVPKSSLPCR